MQPRLVGSEMCIRDSAMFGSREATKYVACAAPGSWEATPGCVAHAMFGSREATKYVACAAPESWEATPGCVAHSMFGSQEVEMCCVCYI